MEGGTSVLEGIERHCPKLQSWKAKGQVKLNPKGFILRDVKDNKTGFYQYIIRKSTTMENVDLLRRKNGDLVRKDNKKAEALKAFFT